MIYLFCGFMGAGKSTFLKYLKETIKDTNILPQNVFLDLDSEILKQNREQTISSLVEKIGWSQFRKLEREKLLSLLDDYQNQKTKNLFIALGGGTLSSFNVDDIQILNINVKIVFLDVSFQTIWSRIKNVSDRPLVSNGKDFIFKLFTEREEIYNKYSNIKLSEAKIFNILSGVENFELE